MATQSLEKKSGDADEILEVFQYAAKVRLSILSGLSPSFLSHPHEHYGSHKEFYPSAYSPQTVSQRLSKYAGGGFIPWSYEREGTLQKRFADYMLLVRRSLDWAFNEVLSHYESKHEELASSLGLAILLTEEGLYQWASNL